MSKNKKAKPEYASANPTEMIDEETGRINKFSRFDFVAGKDGTIAFIDYKMARLEAQKARVLDQGDPTTKLKAKHAKALEKVEALKAELKAAGVEL